MRPIRRTHIDAYPPCSHMLTPRAPLPGVNASCPRVIRARVRARPCARACVRTCARARTRSHTTRARASGAAVIARRPARRQPGKLQARPYFVLSCCFSTRRKEMSEQTRHATPNLLISIHILWLLISSLLHSLFYLHPLPSRHPLPPPLLVLQPSPSRSLTSSRSPYLRTVGSFPFSAILLLASPPIRAIFSSLLLSPSRFSPPPSSPTVGLCSLSSLHLSSPFFSHLLSNILP